MYESEKPSKISPKTKRLEEMKRRFSVNENFQFTNPYLTTAKNDKANGLKKSYDSRSSSHTTSSAYSYDLSLSDDSDDSVEDDGIHHYSNYDNNIKNESRNDWMNYMKSSIAYRSTETQSVTNHRIKIRSRQCSLVSSSLSVLSENTPCKKSMSERTSISVSFSENNEKILSREIRFEIFGRNSFRSGSDIEIFDFEEPFSKSISEKAFYRQVVAELSLLMFRNRHEIFAEYYNGREKAKNYQCLMSSPLISGGSLSQNHSPSFIRTFTSSDSHPVSFSLDERNSEASEESQQRSELSSTIASSLADYSAQLQAAVQADNVALVVTTMKNIPVQDIIDFRDDSKRSLLHIASEFGAVAIVKIFLSAGLDPDALDERNRTCLHLTESAEVVTALCEEGASCDIADSSGETPLHVYIFKENKACLTAILHYGASVEALLPPQQWSGLHLAASLGSAEMIQLILTTSKAVVDVRRRDILQNTALHIAASCERSQGDQLKVVMLLLNLGAPATLVNSRGSSVLHLLCGNRSIVGSPACEPIVEMLLSLDADPNGRDVDGCTPLAVACTCRAWPICALLMEAGADLNISFDMSSPFLASLGSSSQDGTCSPSKTKEEMFFTAEVDKWMRDADCRPNDMLPISVRKMLYSRISVAQTKIPLELRDRCMHCALSFEEEKERKKAAASASLSSSFFGSFGASLSDVVVKFNCSLCGRVVCEKCSSFEVNRQIAPGFLQDQYDDKTFRVCTLCYSIIKERNAQLRKS